MARPTPSWCEFSWFIGLFEGEGSAISDSDGRPRLQLSTTDHDVVKRVQAFVGGRVYGPYKRSDRKDKPYWKWQLATQLEAGALAKRMLPHLNGRRQRQVRKVLQAWKGEA
jgi:hypothetical protein